MIKFYDTATREKRAFEPLEAGRVRVYSCGPTVWDYTHLGNFRSFMFADVLKRYLRYRGFEVHHVMNLTDVDDRIAQKVREAGVSLREYTDRYVEAFFRDSEALNMEPADVYPRATDHIGEMVSLVSSLVERGFAYERAGSVYYSISAFSDYGKFAQLDMSGMQDGVRVDTDKYDKDNARDFVLWKAWTEEDGDVVWDSPFGRGRPGWHLECSAMSTKYLGDVFDIHTGGIDLVFPHHQNEIAQSEGAKGKPFVRCWMHNEFMNVGDTEMSKSAGNQLLVKDIGGADEIAAFRYMAVSSHYRTKLTFTTEALEACRSALQRLVRLFGRLLELSEQSPADDTVAEVADVDWSERIESARLGFREAMDDDLNTPRALAAIFTLVSSIEKSLPGNGLNTRLARQLVEFFNEVDGVLGILYHKPDSAVRSRELPDELATLLEAREEARRSRDWAEADRLRDGLAAAGVEVRDTPEGARWAWL